MKKIILMLAVVSLFSAGCNNSHKENEAKPQEISGITTQIVNKTSVDDFYETSATVNSKIQSIVSSMIMGRITSLNVKEGDRVSAGQILMTIDSRDTAQKALGAQAGVNEALKAAEAANQNRQMVNKTYQRYKNLYQDNVITQQEYDQISTQKQVADIEYQRAQEGINRARAGLGEVSVYQSYSKITAPVSGVVVEKSADLGSTAAPGQPLLTIEVSSSQELVADIDESMLNKIHSGLLVYLENNNETYQSKISSVIPKVDPMTRTFKAKISLSGLKSGEYIKIKIPVAKKEAIVVPQASIVEKGQLTGVYTVDEKNIISYRLIRTGKTSGTGTEVLSGLNDGDKVVISGVDKAIDGGLVK